MARDALAAELARLRKSRIGPKGKPLSLQEMVDDRAMSMSKTAASDYEHARRVLPADLVASYVTFFDIPADGLAQLQRAAQAEESGPGADPQPTSRKRRVLWASAAAAVVLAVALTLAATLHGGGRQPLTGPTFAETTGSSARTWSDYRIAGGDAGQSLTPQQTVQVLCRIRGYVVPDGNAWWYRLASAPYGGRFFATADAFYDDGSTSGPLDNGVIVDTLVPTC